jgi:hypothetical protein
MLMTSIQNFAPFVTFLLMSTCRESPLVLSCFKNHCFESVDTFIAKNGNFVHPTFKEKNCDGRSQEQCGVTV